MLNFAEAVDKSMPLVMEVHKQVFHKYIPADTVKIEHNNNAPSDDQGSHYIEFGQFVLTPIVSSSKTETPHIEWNLMQLIPTPGSRWEPPDVYEFDCGNFNKLQTCLCEIGRILLAEEIGAISYGIYEQEMAAAEAEYEREMKANPPEQELCPHGRKFHECNSCMIASDMAYDAAREQRRFGRNS